LDLSRDCFVDQFAITFGVHCLRGWSRRRNDPPTYLTACFYEWIRISGGRISLSAAEFADLATPVIEEAHRSTPKGQRPDAVFVATPFYEALAVANVEVTLKSVTTCTSAQ